MFSNNYSKRWSSASLFLFFMCGLFFGLVMWAVDKDFNRGVYGFIPFGLLCWLTVWFMWGEEKEWMEARK